MKNGKMILIAAVLMGMLAGCGGGGGDSTPPPVAQTSADGDTVITVIDGDGVTDVGGGGDIIDEEDIPQIPDTGTAPVPPEEDAVVAPPVTPNSYGVCLSLSPSLVASGECRTGDCLPDEALAATFDSEQSCEDELTRQIALFSPTGDNVEGDPESSVAVGIINDIRENVNLFHLTTNIKLENAAMKHADYVKDVYDNYGAIIGHYEDNDSYPSTFYGGVDYIDRAVASGYLVGSYVTENMTYGLDDVQSSVDILMTAIYHRFGFLKNVADEIGVGKASLAGYPTPMSYSMGSLPGKLYTLGTLSPLIVVYPYADETGTNPRFDEENPDPLPNHSGTGNPISVEFNRHIIDTVTMDSFKLFKVGGAEITNKIMMDAETDPNLYFSATQFALFPLDVLEAATEYRVEITYTIDGTSGSKNWTFTTR